FNVIYEIFTGLKYEEQGILIADVTTAFPLTKDQEKKLGLKLAEVTKKKIQIRKHEDKSILGGVIVRVGDKRIDGSAAGRLQALKSTLSVSN
ncbi:MAG: ATP synthase F1 subunit delta, partial [Selenomonadaceae bacterium]|nr:ATP synthase F1 subunit delta [Selenomonadaceae bacterium]